MSPNTEQHTAKIYQFPKRNPAVAARIALVAAGEARQQSVSGIESGSGWYHAKAIEDARTRKP